MFEQTVEPEPFEVYAWGHGFVGARSNLADARGLAADYEGARIITYANGSFRVVAELGLYQTARTAAGDR